MNNHYLLRYLVSEWNQKVTDSLVDLVFTRQKNVLEFIFSNGTSTCLRIDVSPNRVAAFWQPTDKHRPARFVSLFHEILNQRIGRIVLDPNDRRVFFHFESGDQIELLLFGPLANVWFLPRHAEADSFKQRPRPASAAGQNSAQHPDEFSPFDAARTLLSIFPQIPRAHLTHFRGFELLDSPQACRRWWEQIVESEPQFRLLADGSVTRFSQEILPLQTQAIFDSANELVRFAYGQQAAAANVHSRKKEWETFLSRQASSLKMRQNQLGNAEVVQKRAENCRIIADSLMALPRTDWPDWQQVPNIYREGETFDVSAIKGDSAPEKARVLYGKSRNALERLITFESVRRETLAELEVVQTLSRELEQVNGPASLRNWEKVVPPAWREKSVANDVHVFSGISRRKAGNFEVWIGKNAQANDQIVQLAHKEDIWMHARGVEGAHVLIRMERKKSIPEPEILEKAASWAAYFSKARGSLLVPVQWTRKKFVRKPKKALPGTVIVQQEAVLMVKPNAGD